MGKSEYRNSIRSKELIKDAYFNLIREKSVDKITVTDIVNTAKINRGTFYAHYSDIYDLSDSIENEFICDLKQALELLKENNEFSTLSVLLKISEFLKKDEQLYRDLIKSNVSRQLIKKLQNEFSAFMIAHFGVSASKKQSNEYIARTKFVSAGVCATYIAWFNDEIDCSLDSLAHIINDIVIKQSIIFKT